MITMLRETMLGGPLVAQEGLKFLAFDTVVSAGRTYTLKPTLPDPIEDGGGCHGTEVGCLTRSQPVTVLLFHHSAEKVFGFYGNRRFG
jgi:hypothetical protein